MTQQAYKSRYSPTHGAYSKKTIEAKAEELVEWLDASPNNYWLGHFAEHCKMHRNRFPEWARKNEKFRAAYEYAKQRQENYAVHGALHQKLSANFAALMCKNFHGWVDKTETTVSQAPVFNQIDGDKVQKLARKAEKLENKVTEPEIIEP